MGGGGIATNGSIVQDSTASDYSGVGIACSGSSSVVRGLVNRNTGRAMTVVQTITDCAVFGNGAGLLNVASDTGSDGGGNSGAGITGDTVSDNTVTGNAGHSVVNTAAVTNCLLVGNGNIGVSGNNTASVSYCTISGDGSGGVRNLSSGPLNFNNNFGNLV